ncbi:MAG: hypothetical protein KJ646_06110 [Nanoarchaeota archaeon]|nr:hypothetical protein [Nanoarchaeota archaeon]MBU4117021.1 hypothetical protein [Nanoarchaeota archaeon]
MKLEKRIVQPDWSRQFGVKGGFIPFDDFPNQNYNYRKFWKDNETPPIIYHGTTSFIEEDILKEGLIPGKCVGLNTKKDLENLRNIASKFKADEFTKWSINDHCKSNLANFDYDKLHFAIQPCLSASYATRSPECLGHVLKAHQWVLDDLEKIGINRNHPQLHKIHEQIEKYQQLKKEISKHPPMVLSICTDLEKFNASIKEYDQLNFLESREKFEDLKHRKNYHVPACLNKYDLRGSRDGSKHTLYTTQPIPAKDIIGITYLKGDRK